MIDKEILEIQAEIAKLKIGQMTLDAKYDLLLNAPLPRYRPRFDLRWRRPRPRPKPAAQVEPMQAGE